MQNWDAALEDLNKLKDVIDSSVSLYEPVVSGFYFILSLSKGYISFFGVS